MKNTKIIFSLCFVIIFASFFSYATSDSKSRLNDINNNIKDIQSDLKDNKKEQNKINDKIMEFEKTIENTEKQINDINQKMGNTKQEIGKKEAEIQNLQKEIDSNNDLLEKRVNVMSKTSEMDYVQIVLNSEDIMDFLTNLDMIKRIVAHDKNVLRVLKDNKTRVFNAKRDLESKKEQMAVLKNSMDAKKSKLTLAKGEQQSLQSKLKTDAKALANRIDRLNKESEKIKLEILRSQSKSNYVGGEMAWPAPNFTRISSPYGMRFHPVLKRKKMHTGIDISVPRSKTLVAANSGVVTFAGRYGGYGNTVIIDHGGQKSTLYAHTQKLLVKKGDRVTRGQAVALCGSTGLSTGPHLHFEVRVNGNPVNPVPYVKK